MSAYDSDVYSGTCIACMRPTDTGMAFRGVAEWLMAGLIVLGLPEDQAMEIYRQQQRERGIELAEGEAAGGINEMSIRVCAACVAKCPADFPPPVLAIPGAILPVVGQM